MIPSCAPCSEPIRFWPPSPRVVDKYAVRMWRPRAKYASTGVRSSSGCAPIISTEPSSFSLRSDCSISAAPEKVSVAGMLGGADKTATDSSTERRNLAREMHIEVIEAILRRGDPPGDNPPGVVYWDQGGEYERSSPHSELLGGGASFGPSSEPYGAPAPIHSG